VGDEQLGHGPRYGIPAGGRLALAVRPAGGHTHAVEVAMPVYEYRCECGKRMDVLVRGKEPATCSDAAEASDWCDRNGSLSRQLSAPWVGKGGGGGSFYNSHTGAEVSASESCGSCGRAPGSCADD